jgi:hypothetical protein
MTTNADSLTLYPYLKDSCWVFDDARTGLKEEAFVLGATEMITRVVNDKSIPNAEQGFALTFAAVPFAGHDVELRWLRADPAGGNWYDGDVVSQRMEAWLCPALLLYFREPPPRIFIRCGPLPSGVNPIWTPPRGVTGRRFVEAPTIIGDAGATRPNVPPQRAAHPSVGNFGEEGAPPVRFYVPTKPTLIEGFRAFRQRLEQTIGPLSKEWYEDGPDQRPYLYKDQPHLLKNETQDDDHPEARQ